jgi:hypothetical protein
MTLNNAYKIYSLLHEREHQQDKNKTDWLKPLSMDDAIEELMYSLLQCGEGVPQEKKTSRAWLNKTVYQAKA